MAKSKINWENEKDNLIKYLSEGKSYVDIANIYGVDDSTVWYQVKRLRIPESNNSKKRDWIRLNNITKEILEEHIQDGLTNKEIANIYGTTYSAVERAIIRFNILYSRKDRDKFRELKFIKDNSSLRDEILKLLSLGKSYTEISKSIGINRNSINRISSRLEINLPKKTNPFRFKDNNLKLVKDTSNERISNDKLPMPLKYSFSSVISIKLKTKHSKRKEEYSFVNITFYYVPEVGGFKRMTELKTLLKPRKITFDEWENRWLLRLPSDDLYSSAWIDKVVERRYSDKLPLTKLYIKSKLSEDHNYKCDFFALKEDLINMYYLRSSNKSNFTNYDFSLVPDKLKSPKEKFRLIVFDSKSGENTIWETTYYLFINEETDCMIFAKSKMSKAKVKNQEEFIKECKLKYGNKYDYSEVIYKNNKTKVKIYCNKCKKYFWMTPQNHLFGDIGCPYCAKEFIGFHNRSNNSEFIAKARLIHGDLYDYSKVDYVTCFDPVLIIDNETGEEFWQSPAVHLRGCGNPNKKDSKGEKLVKEYLKNILNIQNIKPKKIDGIQGRHSNWVIIDFVFKYLGENIWIEYNGRQHYFQIDFFHKTSEDFKVQLQRDQNVRNYCKENNVLLIEIPYTLNTYESIKDFLDKVILQGIDPNTLIDYQSLYKI